VPRPSRGEAVTALPSAGGDSCASAHGGRGNGVGLIASDESGARLVSSRLTLGQEGRALWAGGWGGEGLARVGRSTRGAAGKDKAKMAGGGSDVQMADAAGAAGSGANGAGGPAGRAGSERALARGHDKTGRQPTVAATCPAAALPRTTPTRRRTKRPSCRASRGRGCRLFGVRTLARRPLGPETASLSRVATP